MSNQTPVETDPRWRLTPTKIIVSHPAADRDHRPAAGVDLRPDRAAAFGFPFFYWYQLAWVFIAAGLCLLSFVLLQRERAAYRRTQPERGGE